MTRLRHDRPAWGEGSVEPDPSSRASQAQQAVTTLLWWLQHAEVGMAIPVPTLEHVFHPTRKWRFDVAWPALRLAVEVDGGVWIGGHHSRGQGIEDDCEKQSTAVSMGWRVMRITPRMIRDGRALTLVIAALQHEEAPR